MAKYNVPPQNLVFGSRDGCSVNDVCTTTLKGQIFKCTNLFDSLCHSHNAHNTGLAFLDPPVAYDDEHNKLPPRVTFSFIKKWNKAYTPTCVSHKAGVAFVEITGEKDKRAWVPCVGMPKTFFRSTPLDGFVYDNGLYEWWMMVYVPNQRPKCLPC